MPILPWDNFIVFFDRFADVCSVFFQCKRTNGSSTHMVSQALKTEETIMASKLPRSHAQAFLEHIVYLFFVTSMVTLTRASTSPTPSAFSTRGATGGRDGSTTF